VRDVYFQYVDRKNGLIPGFERIEDRRRLVERLVRPEVGLFTSEIVDILDELRIAAPFRRGSVSELKPKSLSEKGAAKVKCHRALAKFR
jgi:hypothetical protein